VTPKQMQLIEERSEKLGVDKKQLMLNAGKCLAELIISTGQREVGNSPEDINVVFLAGSGNNGGDCFAAASMLIYKGYNVTVVNLVKAPNTKLAQEMFSLMPGKIKVVTGYRSENIEAAIEAAELDYMTIQDRDVSTLKSKNELTPVERLLLNEKQRIADVREAIVTADILVDGVFGTGYRGELSDDIRAIFSIGTKAYRIAVDIPSGGDSVKGTVSEGIFKADETLCLGCLKFGISQFPLRKYCGKLNIADIGIPIKAYEAASEGRYYVRLDRNSLAGYPPMRERDAHKGTFGSVLIIAGSSSMRGAAAFAAIGALRTGTGLVRVASVEKCLDTVASLAPEATYIEMEADDYGNMLFDSSRDILLDAMKKSDAVVIGPGMGVTNDTKEILRLVVQNAEIPVIIDADGINCIAEDIEILVNKRSEVILTPHPGEMSRLLKCETKMINDNRVTVAEKYAEKYGITLVLKGAGTLISDSKRTASNHTGNPGMSRGGSGDILAGMIGSIAAQGYTPFDAACAGVYMHGLAGDAAAGKFGQEAMLPRDILGCIPDAFRILKEKRQTPI
ncbi:MAG: NAD(P)H-hydrate dehydratase, partial [Ruminococcus sp.]|nr:NAD(P)H-hydrate dehydratase [Ruminococcus sp.]